MKELNTSTTKSSSGKSRGRPSLGDKKLTPAEIRSRHMQKLKAQGGTMLTLRLRNAQVVDALGTLAANFRSETAAAEWILEDYLLRFSQAWQQIDSAERPTTTENLADNRVFIGDGLLS